MLLVVESIHALSAEHLRLPSARDTIRDRIRAEQLIRAGRGPERTLPGVVRDEERVRARVTPDGAIQEVVVDQRLQLGGVGDYFVKIPGPVEEASALPGSSAQPGVRSGSLVWQGFAAGGESLAARVVLDPEHEQERFPLRLSVEARLNGRPTDIDEQMSGVLDLAVSVENDTGAEVSLPSASADPDRVAPVLDRVYRMLKLDRRPEPGQDNVPSSIPVSAPVSHRRAEISAPLSVRVVVILEGTARVLRWGGSVKRSPSRTSASATALLSTKRRLTTFRLRARVSSARIRAKVDGRPDPPRPSEIAPPGEQKSWVAAARAGIVEGDVMVGKLVGILAEVARLPDVDAYLGNPDRDGPARTSYSLEIVSSPSLEVAPSPPRPAGKRPSVVGIILAGLTMLVLGYGAVSWWASS